MILVLGNSVAHLLVVSRFRERSQCSRVSVRPRTLDESAALCTNRYRDDPCREYVHSQPLPEAYVRDVKPEMVIGEAKG